MQMTQTGDGRLGRDYHALIEATRVHGSLYTDPQVFAEELERIFLKGWVFVGHESEIPRPGDWVARKLGLEPVLMLRDRDGQVQVLANRCAHRGTMLCTGVLVRHPLCACEAGVAQITIRARHEADRIRRDRDGGRGRRRGEQRSQPLEQRHRAEVVDLDDLAMRTHLRTEPGAGHHSVELRADEGAHRSDR